MNKTLIAAALTLATGLAFAAGETAPQATPTAQAAPAQAASFEQLDTNKDGTLSGDELKALKNLDMNKADANKDGKLSPAEFKSTAS